MTLYTIGKANFAIKWYRHSNTHRQEKKESNREQLVSKLTELALEAADRELHEDFFEISDLLEDLEKGKEPTLFEIRGVA
ncbi:hypothetical protein NI343_003511 [Salmonella enterica]|nr:hypothetical protein [Salmonella enterica]EJJ4373993.1 hypothetical protein [Salmonella enterica]EKB5296906.1 hypothetical protein [Salmonella enterica]EKC2468857.1 hypothetical protein [Salmonella enterica]EKC2480749.1 hypothetical protein [Salmonella enterica]